MKRIRKHIIHNKVYLFQNNIFLFLFIIKICHMYQIEQNN